MLVAGDGAAGERLTEAGAFALRDQRLQFRREDDGQRLGVALAVEAVDGVRMAVGVGQIRLDVVDRRAVDQICACDLQDRPVLRVQLRP